jgi:hypothetical protein
VVSACCYGDSLPLWCQPAVMVSACHDVLEHMVQGTSLLKVIQSFEC